MAADSRLSDSVAPVAGLLVFRYAFDDPPHLAISGEDAAIRDRRQR